jgi:polysaccharide pyruvyl transferase WcaK-like protein
MGDRRAIVWLDPALYSRNLGDHIISGSVRREVDALASTSDLDVIRLPTQRSPRFRSLIDARKSSIGVVGGTNLLSSNMPWYQQWRGARRVACAMPKRLALLGVGWWQYQEAANRYTHQLLHASLGDGPPHSVRDSYTKEQLERIGITSIMTGCPTMWNLPSEPEKRLVPTNQVVTTVTDYARNRSRDGMMLNLLNAFYSKVYLWPQGDEDVRYASKLPGDLEILDRRIGSLDRLLEGGMTDYVGTRLHAGIRALQFGCRTSIIAVDNRAREIARDTGLPTILPGQLSSDPELLMRERLVRLSIPQSSIGSWRSRIREWLSAR